MYGTGILIRILYVWSGDFKEVDIASYRMQLQLYCNIIWLYCLTSYRDETFLYISMTSGGAQNDNYNRQRVWM